MASLWNSFGFFLFGILIGGIFIELRYRYLALVADRLSGKEEKQESFFFRAANLVSEEIRSVILVALVLIPLGLGIGGLVYFLNYLDAEWYQKNGYVRVVIVRDNGSTSSKWEYKGNNSPLTAEEKK